MPRASGNCTSSETAITSPVLNNADLKTRLPVSSS